MKENSNPFQPALAQPADDSALQTDPNPENFAGGPSPIDNVKPPRPTVSLDGISRPDEPSEDQPVSDSPNTDAAEPAPDTNNADNPQFGGDPLDSVSIEPEAAAPETPTSSDPLSQIAALADDDKTTPPAGTKPPKGQKQPKQFTISILTIIFFVLTLAGIGGTIYFYMQNQKNSDARADAEAKVAQMTDQSVDSSTSENKTSTQFDALQDKVADLTTQNENKQKTLDENKKTIEDLNKKITEKDAQITEQNKKLTNIDTLTNNVTNMVTTLCADDRFKSSPTCATPAQ